MKSRPDYLPPRALLEAGLVMAMNEEKHPNEEWRNMSVEEHLAATLRHQLKWKSGEKIDPETGKSHLTHALCRCAMAVEREMDKQADVDKRIANYGRSISIPESEIEGLREYREMREAEDRVKYAHLFTSPLPAPAQPEYEAWLDGSLKDAEEAPLKVQLGDTVRRYSGHYLTVVDKITDHFVSGKGVDSGLVTHHPHGSYRVIPSPTAQSKTPEQGIDSIKPAQWDAANAAFLAEHQARYANAINNQRKGDEE